MEMINRDKSGARLLVCFLLLFRVGSGSLFSQNKGIDSLEKTLKVQTSDSLRCKVLAQLCSAYSLQNPAKSLEYARELMRVASASDNRKYIAFANLHLGRLASETGNYEEAMKHFVTAKQQSLELKDSAMLS